MAGRFRSDLLAIGLARDFGIRRLRLCLVPFVALLPEATGDHEGIDTTLLPPLSFFACGVDVVVVDGAKWNRELVAHLQAEPSRLGVAYVVGMRRRAPADQARLTRHKAQMLFATNSLWLAGRSKSSAHSPTMMSVFAISPCFRELRRERALPACVLGPVLFSALALFAGSC